MNEESAPVNWHAMDPEEVFKPLQWSPLRTRLP
jgi:hypothetical protein